MGVYREGALYRARKAFSTLQNDHFDQQSQKLTFTLHFTNTDHRFSS